MSCSLVQRSVFRPFLGYFTNSRIKCSLPISNYCCKQIHTCTKDMRIRNVPLIKVPPKEREAIFSYEPESMDIVDVDKIVAADETFQMADYFQVHNLFTIRDLFDARVHYGHKIGSLNSHMKPFVYGHRFETVIFDLDVTAFHLRQALNFLAHIAYRKGIILFITRSPNTMNMVEKVAIEVGEYAHCRTWESAILTNSTAKFGGITRLPDLIILMSTLDTVMAEHRAVIDASKMLIPTIAIVDSNSEPNLITYPIPGNDDSPIAVEFYLKMFKEAIMRGKNRRKLNDSQQSDKKLNE